MTAAERLSWLRRLLEDVPVIERETSTADGTSTDFILRNPPVRAVLGVWVDGAQQTVGTAFSLVDAEVVRFTRPPTAASSVVMVYDRQTFDDAELVQYLDVAAVDWTRDLGIVYAAGCLALDALLLGSATALRFGAGARRGEPAQRLRPPDHRPRAMGRSPRPRSAAPGRLRRTQRTRAARPRPARANGAQ